jgi:formate transporter
MAASEGSGDGGSDAGEDVPPRRYLPADQVMGEMASFGDERLHVLRPGQVLVLAVVAGGFITVGALLSVLLGTGVEPAGVASLVEGLAFATGFFFVVLSESVLFTEANVVIPATLLSRRESAARVVRFWTIAVVGNLLGALVVAGLIALAHDYPATVVDHLAEVVEGKMARQRGGSVADWLRVVLSGTLANWLVGMAAFFAMMGRTILGKYIPVALAVAVFVAAGFQHSLANMGFFSLLMLQGNGPGWVPAISWNLVPAGIGNLIGGTLFVALPLWYGFRNDGSGGPPVQAASARGRER